jgi:hypothetical protein
MKIIRGLEFKADHAWGAKDIANINGILMTENKYLWF